MVFPEIMDFWGSPNICEKDLPIKIIHNFKLYKENIVIWLECCFIDISHELCWKRHFYKNYFVCLILKFA